MSECGECGVLQAVVDRRQAARRGMVCSGADDHGCVQRREAGVGRSRIARDGTGAEPELARNSTSATHRPKRAQVADHVGEFADIAAEANSFAAPGKSDPIGGHARWGGRAIPCVTGTAACRRTVSGRISKVRRCRCERLHASGGACSPYLQHAAVKRLHYRRTFVKAFTSVPAIIMAAALSACAQMSPQSASNTQPAMASSDPMVGGGGVRPHGRRGGVRPNGRRGGHVSAEDDHPERGELAGSHDAGRRREGRRTGRNPVRTGPFHRFRADQRSICDASRGHRTDTPEA